jgi:hypothetical protein
MLPFSIIYYVQDTVTSSYSDTHCVQHITIRIPLGVGNDADRSWICRTRIGHCESCVLGSKSIRILITYRLHPVHEITLLWSGSTGSYNKDRTRGDDRSHS